jgi:hypothetical protein
MSREIAIFPRKSGFRTQRKLVLIVCEGARTEPSYFECFPLPKNVREIYGAGANTLSVVKESIKIRDKGNFDEIWCVFDRDSFPIKRIVEAFKLAKSEKINIAFSNESFELWYLLHFHYLDTAITRQDYCQRLAVLLGGKYKKNDPTMYKRLISSQTQAIKNAKKLYKDVNPNSLHSSCPVTTVYQLVERLNELIAKV